MEVTEEMKRKAQENAERSKNLHPSIQYAIAVVAANFLNGANWGFCDNEGIAPFLADIKKNPNMLARNLNGKGCLVEISNEKYIVDCITSVDPTILFTEEERRLFENGNNQQKKMVCERNKVAKLTEIAKDRKTAMVELEKFLQNRVKDAKPYNSLIGIYCINDTPSMTKDGKQYNAFRVDAISALKLLHKYGFKVVIEGKAFTPQQCMDAKLAGHFWNSLVLNETARGIRGVFIHIAK